MEQARRNLSEVDYNKLSVKLELQADFYAGVWAHYEAKNKENGIKIDRADIDSALVAAHAIGDDRLQQQSTGRVEPDSFTHGTSAQRAYWFKWIRYRRHQRGQHLCRGRFTRELKMVPSPS